MAVNREKKVRQEFCYALQALAVEPEEQVATLTPGCVTCELKADFVHTLPRFLRNAGEALEARVREGLDSLSATLEDVPEKDWECHDNEALTRDSWTSVRDAARQVLAALEWPLRVPPPYEEARPGRWRRPAPARRNMQSARNVFVVSVAAFSVSLGLAYLPEPSWIGVHTESARILLRVGGACLAFVTAVISGICGMSLMMERMSQRGARLAAQGRGSS